MVETCSVTAADCPRLVLSHIERTGQGFRPAMGGFFLSAKDTFQRPPATRWTGIFQNFFCLSNPGNGILATGGAENFSFHSQHHRVLKFAKRGRQLFSGFIYLLRVIFDFAKWTTKKAANLFQDLLLHVLPLGGGYSVLSIARGGQHFLLSAP